MATNEEIIRMLYDDLRDEHGALILYLQHAYMIGEGEEACEIEQSARDEMRHFKWLAQAIVQLGGQPILDRTEMELGGKRPADWMQRDVRAEEDAIAQYEAHKAAIDDAKIKALIDRILTDERAHLGVFTSLQSKYAPGGKRAAEEPVIYGGEVTDQVAAIVDYATKHEYTVVLQYLFHSFATPDHEASRELETIAINEMQHLGWFGEYAAGSGHFPLFVHQPVDKGRDTPDMLQADLEAEKQVEGQYGRQVTQLGDAPEHAELVEILERAQDNERYHIHTFGRLLDRAGAGEPLWQRPGVGPTQPPALDPAPEESAIPDADAPSSEDRGSATGRGPLTLGSLIE